MSGPADTILFLHASADLYGSDRTLLELVAGLDRSRWRAVVALPRRGSLAAPLEQAGAAVEIGELGIAQRSSLTARGLLALVWRVPRGAVHTLRLIRRHRPRVVHTNTAVVLGGALGARLARVPHLWHVHEILTGPRWMARFGSWLFGSLADAVLCNSEATREAACAHRPRLRAKTRVVPNGVAPVEPRVGSRARAATRAAIGVPASARLVLCPGRINAWKGQALAVRALGLIEDPSVWLVIVGDPPPGQPGFAAELDRVVRASPAAARIVRLPFQPDLDALYRAADVCAVPSTRPEPFGLVAVEAMARGLPVVAAGHGGLAEVVLHGQSGLVFVPGDAQALATALEEVLHDPARARAMGDKGRRRQRALYTLERYVAGVADCWEALAEPRPRVPARARIVHVLPGKANPERLNGVNRAVHELAAAQVGAGRAVEVWGLTPRPDAPTPARPYTLRLFRWRRPRPRLDPDLRRALDRLRGPAVFHLHGGLLPEMARVARALERAGFSYVFTPHGAYRREALARRWLAKRLCLALFDRRLCAGARAVQALAPADAVDVARVAGADRVVTIPNGQDPGPRVPLRARSKDALTFGFLGRLLAYTKGLDLLLDGFAAYASRGGTGTLVLIGDGPDRRALEKRARRRGVGLRVRFAGARVGADKERELAALDALVHPSRHEGLPGAVLEAAARGLPLVVGPGTNLGTEVRAAGAGLALERADAEAVAEALTRVERAGAEGRARWGEAARQMVVERFSWERIERELARDLYGLEEPARPERAHAA